MADKVNAPQIKIAYLQGQTKSWATECDKNKNGKIDTEEIKVFSGKAEVDYYKEDNMLHIDLMDKSGKVVEGTELRQRGNSMCVAFGTASNPDVDTYFVFDHKDKLRMKSDGKNVTVYDKAGGNACTFNPKTGEIKE